MPDSQKSEKLSVHARHEARCELLRTMEAKAPEVVRSLRELGPSDWATKLFGRAELARRQGEITLDAWAISPSSEKNGEFARYAPVFYRGLDVKSASSFTYKPWNPNREARGAFRQRILRHFTRHIDEEIAAQDEKAALPEIPAFRNLERDAAWLVHYQFLGFSYTRIAQGVDGNERATTAAVRKAVQALAAVVEIDLRQPDPAGRPARRHR